MRILKKLDPTGVELRRSHRLQRRIYLSRVCIYTASMHVTIASYGFIIFVQGPNFCWHLDGYDKLSPFGFHIHGCIDG